MPLPPPRDIAELKLPPIRNVGISGQKAEDLVKRFEPRRGRKETGDRHH